MSNILEEARANRKAIVAAVPSLDDKTASTAATLFPKLNENGELVKAGTRINWNGVLKRAAVDLWDRPENNPDNAPALWEDIEYREGYRIIPDTITSGLAFAKNELGWRGDILYKSIIDANVWTPEAYPPAWEIVAEN